MCVWQAAGEICMDQTISYQQTLPHRWPPGGSCALEVGVTQSIWSGVTGGCAVVFQWSVQASGCREWRVPVLPSSTLAQQPARKTPHQVLEWTAFMMPRICRHIIDNIDNELIVSPDLVFTSSTGFSSNLQPSHCITMSLHCITLSLHRYFIHLHTWKYFCKYFVLFHLHIFLAVIQSVWSNYGPSLGPFSFLFQPDWVEEVRLIIS